MADNIDIISKKAAFTALEAAIKMHILRAEELAAEAQKLNDEINENIIQDTEVIK